jgi:hypothetical protein
MNNYKYFALLCESLLVEASTTSDIISRHPGGQMLMKHMHQKHGLLHDQQYEEIPKISWRVVKEEAKTWLLLIGSLGVGAIKWSNKTDKYHAIVATRGEIESFADDRAGNVVDFLKTRIGTVRKMYLGAEDIGSRRKIIQRHAITKAATPVEEMTVDKLVQKFKPLFFKAVEQAKADIKGIVSHMVKNDLYNKAKARLDKIIKLETALEEIRGNQVPGIVRSAVNDAVILAAKHFYPAEAGDIIKTYQSGYVLNNSDVITKLLQDIANGDTKKLGSILGFLKQRLIK